MKRKHFIKIRSNSSTSPRPTSQCVLVVETSVWKIRFNVLLYHENLVTSTPHPTSPCFSSRGHLRSLTESRRNPDPDVPWTHCCLLLRFLSICQTTFTVDRCPGSKSVSQGAVLYSRSVTVSPKLLKDPSYSLVPFRTVPRTTAP